VCFAHTSSTTTSSSVSSSSGNKSSNLGIFGQTQHFIHFSLSESTQTPGHVTIGCFKVKVLRKSVLSKVLSDRAEKRHSKHHKPENVLGDSFTPHHQRHLSDYQILASAAGDAE
jgi:hypothetical protein